MTDQLPSGRRSTPLIITIPAGLTILVLLWLTVSGMVASVAEKRVERRWAETVGSQAELFSLRPEQTTNRSALILEQLCRPLGIDVVPREAPPE